MKRKIAAIFAADIAGYSRLVAEDEEETLRRLASYRSVTDDFIAKAGGRIFNTAGDAVLAEFPSAVEAVRCAIDIQESLRTRNMAYPASRHMSYRIGITIGDVVERDGDLLGDGVNIAARLEGLAEVGGICISRSVHEQVANKLSVQFADIGAQEVKNIPNPIHAFMVAMRREDGTYTAPQMKKPTLPPPLPNRNWMWPAAAALVCVVAIGTGGFVYFTKIKNPQDSVAAAPVTPLRSVSTPAVAATTAPVTTQKQASLPATPDGERLATGSIPLISDQLRLQVAREYSAAAGYKALAISTGPIGLVTGQTSEEAAKAAAIDECQKEAGSRKCELYAVGDAIVYAPGPPPMPPIPWIKRDPLIEKPFAGDSIPFSNKARQEQLQKAYGAASKPKALALGPRGQYAFFQGQSSAEEAARRSLENCGLIAKIACVLLALDDTFVAPLPTRLKTLGFFRAGENTMIAPDARADVARRIAQAPAGWSAVAVGEDGKPGLALKASSEQAAVNDALGECVKKDSDCHVIAIGPFLVGPN
jgi:class 3 adenylate cyclase